MGPRSTNLIHSVIAATGIVLVWTSAAVESYPALAAGLVVAVTGVASMQGRHDRGAAHGRCTGASA